LEINKDLGEWIDLIEEHNIILRLNNGENFKAINIELGLEPGSDSLRKAIKRLDYKKDKHQEMYYLKSQRDIVRYMNSIDVEDLVEQYSKERYFECFKAGFFDREKRNPETFIMDEDIYKEYAELSEEFGYEGDPEDLIHLVLLQWLDKNKPMNKIRTFVIRSMEEEEYFTEEIIELVMKKEKEGYDLHSLYCAADSYDLLELTQEEFAEHVAKREE